MAAFLAGLRPHFQCCLLYTDTDSVIQIQTIDIKKIAAIETYLPTTLSELNKNARSSALVKQHILQHRSFHKKGATSLCLKLV